MMTFLIIGLAVLVAWLVIVVCLQAGTIRNYQEIDRLYQIRVSAADDQTRAAEAAVKFQEQRYHLMWDVRRLEEQQIAALQMACNQMAAWIKSQQGNSHDAADAWKPPGWKPGAE